MHNRWPLAAIVVLLCITSIHAACSSPPAGTVFCDDFEAGNLNSWDQADTTRFAINTNAAFVKTGTRSLQGTINTAGGGTLDKWFMPGYDEIWIQYDILFESGFQNLRGDGYGMHLIDIGGNDVNNQWSSYGKAGLQPSGTDYFLSGIDPYHVPSTTPLAPFMFYTYWPEMSCPAAPALCYGNEIYQTAPQSALTAGTWQQVTIHFKANTVGQHDGLQELYVDGVKKIDMQGMRWRDTNNLKWNSVSIPLYMPNPPKTERIWFDNFVISTQPIIGSTAPSSLTGDVNGDGTVNIQDVFLIASCVGQAATGTCATRDINGDGNINIFDFVRTAQFWGQTASTDNTAPTATITAPTANQVLAAGTPSTTLSVTTNEAASCKYSTSSSATYNTMTSTMSGTGTSHTATLSGLANGNPYTYYVRCQDTAGNAMTSSQSVSFSVASPSPVCGNSVVESGEQCDTGSSRGACPATCSLTCTTNSCSVILGGLVAAYGFEENAGTTTADSSGFSNTGTLTNGLAWAAGKNGRGLSFDGVNDYLQIPSSSSLNAPTSGITIEFWLNPLDGGTDAVPLAKPNVDGSNAATPYQYGIEIDRNGADTLDAFLMSSTGANNMLSTPVTYGSWNHYALTYDGTTIRWYKNGAQVASSAASFTLTTKNTPLRLGVDSGLGQPYQGGMDDVRIYSRALSQAEIQTDMNTGVATSPPVCGDNICNGVETTATCPGDCPAVPPVVTFSANPNGIVSGNSATLTWSSTNANSCTASNGWTGTKATSGTQSVSPTSTTTYSLTCTGPGGTSALSSTTVTVTAAPVCGNGVIEGTEECDGTNLGGASCTSKGYTGGTISCSASCTLNTASCTGLNLFPNKPASYTQSQRIDFSMAPPTASPDNIDQPIPGAPGWYQIYYGTSWSKISDATATASAPGVWQGFWPAGSHGGGIVGQGSGYGIGNLFMYYPSSQTRMYAAIRFKVNPGYQWHPISNKWVNIECGSTSLLLVQLNEGGNWLHAEQLVNGGGSFWVDPGSGTAGQVANTAISTGNWHLIEVNIDIPAKTWKIWLDGQLTTNAANLPFVCGGMSGFAINAFRGGGGDVTTADGYWYYDDVYVAWP